MSSGRNTEKFQLEIGDLNASTAKTILFKSHLPDNEFTLLRQFAAGSKTSRQTTYRQQRLTLEGQTCAAIEIQRIWRGYLLRCKLLNALLPQLSQTAVYSDSQHIAMRIIDFRGESSRKSVPRQNLEYRYRCYVDHLRQSGDDSVISFESYCAVLIQKDWRHYRKMQANITHLSPLKSLTGRRVSSQHRRSSTSPLTPTNVRPFSFHSVSKRKPLQKGSKSPVTLTGVESFKTATPVKEPLTEKQAAQIIQRTWRRFIDIQVFRYYRDLINFRNRGDPALMLRCINPKESCMMDMASGVHVRFRLAGSRFPPAIYYKIFTHRPVVDMCANSPKDYTQASCKQPRQRDVHNQMNKKNSPPQQDSHVGWYQRIENNGWRLVSDRQIQHALNDPITCETGARRVSFHHNKLQRKQDVAHKRKMKKIEWMRKMYHDGLLRAKENDFETMHLVEGAAAGMVATVDRHGNDALEEWEVDELLDWTTGLNFENYMTDWKEIATSSQSGSDKVKLMTSKTDPYELELSGLVSRFQSTQQSQHDNTPLSSIGRIPDGTIVNMA